MKRLPASAQERRFVLRRVFAPFATLERLIAAFLWTSALALFCFGGNYAQTDYTAAVPLLFVLLCFVGFFAVFSVLSVLFATEETDRPALFLGGVLLLVFALPRFATPWLYAGFCLLAFLLLSYVFPTAGRLFSRIEQANGMRRLPAVVLFAFAGILCVFLSLCTVCKVLGHSLATFDFGIFAQMFENMRTTGLPDTTVERNRLLSHFAVHFSPIWYLWLPFYALFPHAATLEVLQALTVCSAVIPLYRLARRRGLSGTASAAVGLLLLLYPAFSLGCLYSVHENKFLLPLLLWLFDFAERKSIVGTAVFALLVLSVKEDAFVYVFFFALFWLLHALRTRTRRETVTALSLMAGSFVWFFAVSAYLSSAGEGVMSWRYANFDYLGNGSLLTVVKSVLLNPLQVFSEAFEPEKIPFILLTCLPLAPLLFCTRKWERLVLFCPYLLVNLMTDWPYQHSIYFQYTYGSCAFLFLLAVLNLSDLAAASAGSQSVAEVTDGSAAACSNAPDGRKSRVAFLLCLALLFCMLAFAGTVRDGGSDGIWGDNTASHVGQWWENRHTEREIEDLLSVVPEDATVGADTYYVVSLARCAQLYDLASGYPIASDIVFDWVVVNLRAEGEQYDRYANDPCYAEYGRVEGRIAVFYRQ